MVNEKIQCPRCLQPHGLIAISIILKRINSKYQWKSVETISQEQCLSNHCKWERLKLEMEEEDKIKSCPICKTIHTQDEIIHIKQYHEYYDEYPKYFCSQCHNKFMKYLTIKESERCVICGWLTSLYIDDGIDYPKLEYHHVKYIPEEIIPVCRYCHKKIHKSTYDDPVYGKYKPIEGQTRKLLKA